MNKTFKRKLLMFSYPSVLTEELGSQKIRHIESVLMSTHNIRFGREIRKIFLLRTLYSGNP